MEYKITIEKRITLEANEPKNSYPRYEKIYEQIDENVSVIEVIKAVNGFRFINGK
jgi:hypothetical protein